MVSSTIDMSLEDLLEALRRSSLSVPGGFLQERVVLGERGKPLRGAPLAPAVLGFGERDDRDSPARASPLAAADDHLDRGHRAGCRLGVVGALARDARLF